MQAIPNDIHQKLCKFVQDMIARQEIPDNDLVELESELQNIYEGYRQRIDELKSIILTYDEKRRSIKNKMKLIQRKEMANSQNKKYYV